MMYIAVHISIDFTEASSMSVFSVYEAIIFACDFRYFNFSFMNEIMRALRRLVKRRERIIIGLRTAAHFRLQFVIDRLIRHHEQLMIR